MLPEYLPMCPESLEIANTYLATSNIQKTAETLGLPLNVVSDYIGKPEVQKYITEIYLNSGYRNRFKIGELMDRIIDDKLLELNEAGITSTKDIVDILALAHKMRLEELNIMVKLEEAKNKVPAKQTNIQINSGHEKRSIFETLIGGIDEIQ